MLFLYALYAQLFLREKLCILKDFQCLLIFCICFSYLAYMFRDGTRDKLHNSMSWVWLAVRHSQSHPLH